MEDADKELQKVEEMLRALAAEDLAEPAQDATLLARLREKADAACRRHRLRPWYRSRILWRSAAVLLLLAAIPALWSWWYTPRAREVLVQSLPDIITKDEVPMAVKSESSIAPVAVVTAEVADEVCGVAEVSPEAVAVVAEPASYTLTDTLFGEGLGVNTDGIDPWGMDEDCESQESVNEAVVLVTAPAQCPPTAASGTPNDRLAGPKCKRASRKAAPLPFSPGISELLRRYGEALQKAARPHTPKNL